MYASSIHLKTFILFVYLSLLAFSSSIQASDSSYCNLFNSKTESGKKVTGICYMYSDQFGQLQDAKTENGESVTGSCYRYNEQYAELQGAKTEKGETVTGGCYIY